MNATNTALAEVPMGACETGTMEKDNVRCVAKKNAAENDLRTDRNNVLKTHVDAPSMIKKTEENFFVFSELLCDGTTHGHGCAGPHVECLPLHRVMKLWWCLQ